MQTWKATCTDGFTKSVMAETKDEAVKILMADPDFQKHAMEKHPELASKTPEEINAMLASMTEAVPTM
jgi:tripartite-type tricarboxylate transporter receptor subunit TctC